jgi:hypothetical protein
MNAVGRIHDLLRHFVFSQIQPKTENISRKDAKIAKKTSPASVNPEIIAEGSGRARNWKIQFRHWTAKR